MSTYSLLNSVASALFVVQDNVILFANTAAVALCGYSTDSLQTIPFTDLLLPEHRNDFPAWRSPALAGLKIKASLLTASGEVRTLELTTEALETGDSPTWLVTGMDITPYLPGEAPQKPEKLARSFQDLLKALQKVSLQLAEAESLDELYQRSIQLGRSDLQFDRMGLWLVDEDPNFITGTFGTDENGDVRDERGVRLPQDVMHRSGLERVRFFDSRIRVYISKDIPLLNHLQNSVGDGWIMVAFMMDRGAITGYLCADNLRNQIPMAAYQPELLALYASTLTHLIRRKRTELELSEARRRYAELVDNIPGMVYRTHAYPDESQSFDYLSPRCYEFTGVTQDDALRDISLLLNQIHPDDLADYRRTSDESTRTNTRFLWDGRFIVNNEVTWRRVESHPRSLPDGSVIWDGIVTDITAQRLAEESIRQSEANARLFQERLKMLGTMSIRLATLDSVEELCRQAVLMAHHDLQFDRASLWLLDDDREYMRGTFGIDEHGQLRDERHIRMIRRPSPAEETFLKQQTAKLKNGDIDHLDVFLSEETRLQDEYASGVGRGWLIMASLTSADNIIGFLYVDNFLSQQPLAQHDPELLGLYAATLSNLYVRKQIEQELRQSEERYRMLAEFTTDIIALTQADGRFVYVSPSFVRTLGYTLDDLIRPDAVQTNDFRRAIDTLMDLPNMKETTRFEFRVRQRSGEYIWLESYASPIFDGQGQVSQVLISSRDITERRQVQTLRFEQEKLRVALDKERELSDLKTHMMERISHEFRTPLTIIGTASDLLERYYQRLTETQRQVRLEQIKKQIKHLSVMLDNIGLLTYSRLTRMPLDMHVLNLEKLCQDIVAHVQSELPSARRIVFVPGENIQHVKADKQIIWHIVYQLISNAIKYSAETGTVWLNAAYEQDTVILIVRDEGPGITPEDQKRMFEPFYRSRRLDEKPGLGLGLSIVREALDAHYGTLTVDSEPDKGTVFTVRLPAIAPGESRETGTLFARGE